MQIRNIFYDIGLFKVKKFPIKVVSIGNITAGGTGKTPFVIALCQNLQTKFSHIVIISRGYGRKTKGAHLVSLRGQLLISDASQSGDEPLLIAESCRHATVVVAEKRYLAWELIKYESPDLILLDDAFQHRRIHRDLDILLINGNRPLDTDFVIPLGKLREFSFNSKRADVIAVTKKKILVEAHKKPCFFIKSISNFDTLDKNIEYLLICAIAEPEGLIEELKHCGIRLKELFIFPDHADFKQLNIDKLKGYPVLCTEKDYTKLKVYDKLLSFHTIKKNFVIDQNLIDII